MNNLPDTFEGLLKLLRQFEEDCTLPEFGTIDMELLGEKVDALLFQYEQKEKQGAGSK